MLNMKNYNENLVRRQEHLPHGLSRASGNGAVLPVVLGLVCATLVMGIFWLAYTLD